MSDHDDEMPDGSLEEFAAFERERAFGLRCFKVWLFNGETEHIWAHAHDNTNPAGHLNFITTSAEGKHQILDSFAQGVWVRLREIVDGVPLDKRQVH